MIGPPPSRGRPRRAGRGAGFTLIELLVALAIFALLSAFAYRGVGAMLDSREALQQETRKWRDVSLFVSRLERDLAAVLDRPATGASGTPLAAVSSALETPVVREGLALTRSGSPLQDNALAAPQRIAYRLREDRVERLAWASTDAAPRDEPVAVPVLSGVAGLGFRFLERGEWLAQWGLPGNAAQRPPAAIEVTLRLASGERIVRVVDMPRTGP